MGGKEVTSEQVVCAVTIVVDDSPQRDDSGIQVPNQPDPTKDDLSINSSSGQV